MNLLVKPAYAAICALAAQRIAQLLRDKPNAVLGLATGSTPIGVYAELVRMHRDEGLDFSRVTSFNLDEYYPMDPDATQSYRRFMREHLFDHINCNNWHVPDGRGRDAQEIAADCLKYESAISEAGGIDLQLLGIGRSGHIGFNEPGSARESRTRLVTLEHITRLDAAPDFFGLANVPVRAITMGVGTILDAREIVIMAAGARKANVVQSAIEDKITSKIPASLLREHADVVWYLDQAAAARLTQFAEPWTTSQADFNDRGLQRRTLINAALQRKLPLSQLRDVEAIAQGMSLDALSLAKAVGETESSLRRATRDKEFLPKGKQVFCLSPHPDDDVICCGATLLKMTGHGNQVTVGYGVSGANAVRDKDVLALLRAQHPRMILYLEENSPSGQSLAQAIDLVRHLIFERQPGEGDAPLLRELKRVLRQGEAADACRQMGAKPIFMNLPFYGQGAGVVKTSDEDVSIMLGALRQSAPDIVLLTGELNDPHGTHELCGAVFEQAAAQYLQAGGAPFEVWHYRGAWDEFEVAETSYFSVFDKEMMERKIGLILDHVSQLDPLFPGTNDPREFYERARDRNRETARQLQTLGILPPSRSFAPVYVESFQIQPVR